MRVETQRLIDRYVGTIICRIFSIYYKILKKKPHPNRPKSILIILLSEMGALVLDSRMIRILLGLFGGGFFLKIL